jgi:homogentisate 1,2-dioxygenase
MSKTITETKDNFVIYQQSIDKYFTQAEQAVSRYFQALTDLQEEYIHAWRNAFKANLSLQKEFATKSGFDVTLPEPSKKIFRDMTDEFLKTRSVRDQIAIATIDTAKKNVKTFSDNASAFADLNRDIMQSWISLCTLRDRQNISQNR